MKSNNKTNNGVKKLYITVIIIAVVVLISIFSITIGSYVKEEVSTYYKFSMVKDQYNIYYNGILVEDNRTNKEKNTESQNFSIRALGDINYKIKFNDEKKEIYITTDTRPQRMLPYFGALRQ